MVSGKRNLEGKVAIVTGAGTGLGKAMALTLAKAGADIVVAGRRVPPIEQTAKEISDLGRRSLAISTDVADSTQCNQLIERTVAEMGRLDILINNAGGGRGGGGRKPIQDWTDDDWHYVMDSNVTGAFYCCRAVAKHFLAQKKGKVINVASGFGLRGLRDSYAYCAAKAGIILLTRSLALSWARDNIQVNTIAPGFIDVTEWQPEPRPVSASADRRQAFTPVGRTGIPEDIAYLALFLASDASDYITGELLSAEGGAFAGGFAPVRHAPIIPLEEE